MHLEQLAIDRGGSDPGASSGGRSLAARYLLPGVLLAGFLLVLGWAMRDAFLPKRNVKVVPVLVSLAAIQESGAPLFKAGGWVEPRPTPIRVPALANGVIEELLVVEDQAVKKHEIIARLVDDDAKLALQATQATVALREADLDQCQAILTAAETNYEEPTHLAEAAAAAAAELARVETALSDIIFQIEAAAARKQLAEIELKGKLAAGDALSRITIDKAKSDLTAINAQFAEVTNRQPSLQLERKALVDKNNAATRRLELKTDEKRTLDEAKAQLAAAQAKLDQATVAEAQAQLQLDRMTIKSPVAGRVLHLLTSPGTHLSGGMGRSGQHDGGVVVTLYQPSQLQVRVDVRFEDLPRTDGDQPVLVESAAIKKPMHGRVLFHTSLADIQKNTLEVKVVIDDPPELLKPEMLVDVTFFAPKRAETETPATQEYRLFVPAKLVRTTEGGSFVWVADQAAGIARRIKVTVEPIRGKTMVEITGGLTAASRLITGDVEGLADGDRINVTGEDDAGRTNPSAQE
jgi:RND family efflux transporter MFP subunit